MASRTSDRDGIAIVVAQHALTLALAVAEFSATVAKPLPPDFGGTTDRHGVRHRRKIGRWLHRQQEKQRTTDAESSFSDEAGAATFSGEERQRVEEDCNRTNHPRKRARPWGRSSFASLDDLGAVLGGDFLRLARHMDSEGRRSIPKQANAHHTASNPDETRRNRPTSALIPSSTSTTTRRLMTLDRNLILHSSATTRRRGALRRPNAERTTKEEGNIPLRNEAACAATSLASPFPAAELPGALPPPSCLRFCHACGMVLCRGAVAASVSGHQDNSTDVKHQPVVYGYVAWLSPPSRAQRVEEMQHHRGDGKRVRNGVDRNDDESDVDGGLRCLSAPSLKPEQPFRLAQVRRAVALLHRVVADGADVNGGDADGPTRLVVDDDDALSPSNRVAGGTARRGDAPSGDHEQEEDALTEELKRLVGHLWLACPRCIQEDAAGRGIQTASSSSQPKHGKPQVAAVSQRPTWLQPFFSTTEVTKVLRRWDKVRTLKTSGRRTMVIDLPRTSFRVGSTKSSTTKVRGGTQHHVAATPSPQGSSAKNMPVAACVTPQDNSRREGVAKGVGPPPASKGLPSPAAAKKTTVVLPTTRLPASSSFSQFM